MSDNAYPTYAVTKKKLKASGVKMEKQASVSEDIGCVVLELGYFIDFFGKGLQDPFECGIVTDKRGTRRTSKNFC